MSEPSSVDPENAIRRYLLFLDDPTKLRDEGEVQRRTVAVLEAADPIEKLKALAALERAASVDEAELRDGFVRHAKSWADDHGISVRAFRELKVPDNVLAAAGFDVPAGRRRGRPPTPEGGEGRPRRRMVSSRDIKDAVLAFTEPFTLNDVMAKAGGSPLTVRKAVDELIDEGRVDKRGPVPDYRGRGRAPVQYAVR
jgi:hypothetical protein